jgi:hypothetical protein
MGKEHHAALALPQQFVCRVRHPAAARAAVQQLLGKAILKWGTAAPVKFAKRDVSWDFEVVMRQRRL